jgi:hypothetical protein
MQVNGAAEIRPRSTGEILDDAWRLYLADAPFLLVTSGLFLVPAFAVLLLLLTRPTPTPFGGRALLPVLAATTLALTGVGSGASQELFRRRAEGQRVSVSDCLGAALRRGLEHVAARSLVLCGVLLGLSCVIMPGLTIWVGSTSVHALIAAGKGRSWAGLQELGREATFEPSKAAAVTLSRIPMLLFAVVNLHLIGSIGVWLGANLAGLDTALLAAQMTPSNPVYLVALGMFAWLLLTPYHEAANFLLHSDTRARQEGLDLLYRVQRVFGTSVPQVRQTSAVLMALVVGWLLTPTLVQAVETSVEVRQVREGVARIRGEVKAAEPYPGGARWDPRLQALGRRLTTALGNPLRSRGFHQAIAGFRDRKQQDALQILADLEDQLALLEEILTRPRNEPGEGDGSQPGHVSGQAIKNLLRHRGGEPEGDEPPEEKVKKDRQDPEERRDPLVRGPRGGAGGGVLRPQLSGGFGMVAWLVLGGMVLAVLVAAVVFAWTSRSRSAKNAPKTKTSTAALKEELFQPREQSAEELWQLAAGLAREGRYRAAVRDLYLGVLALLHRQHLLEYQPTRTNGEYLRQVRLAPTSPPNLHQPFRTMTRLFEDHWYGERGCAQEDYDACRRLAEEICSHTRGAN